jgi:hypothetical protein
MTKKNEQHEQELSEEEIAEQNGEELPDREVMSVMNPAAPVHNDVILPLPPES